jgi:hypothetical protein
VTGVTSAEIVASVAIAVIAMSATGSTTDASSAATEASGHMSVAAWAAAAATESTWAPMPATLTLTAVRPQTGPAADMLEIRVPAHWQRAEGGNAVLFTDHIEAVAVVATISSSKTPSVAAVRDVLLPQVAADRPGYHLLNVSRVTLPAGPAVRATYVADSVVAATDAASSEPVRDQTRQYVLNHDGVQVSLEISSPVGRTNEGTWQDIANSLRWLH